MLNFPQRWGRPTVIMLDNATTSGGQTQCWGWPTHMAIEIATKRRWPTPTLAFANNYLIRNTQWNRIGRSRAASGTHAFVVLAHMQIAAAPKCGLSLGLDFAALPSGISRAACPQPSARVCNVLARPLHLFACSLGGPWACTGQENCEVRFASE